MVATPFTGVSTASVVIGAFNSNPPYQAYSGVGYASWTTLKSGVGFLGQPHQLAGLFVDNSALSPRPCSLHCTRAGISSALPT